MARYWFIIDRSERALFDALVQVLKGRAGYAVIEERRSGDRRLPSGERRRAKVWEGGSLRIAEEPDETLPEFPTSSPTILH